MKITYYLNESRKKNLYCRISDGTERVTFSLDHSVDPKQWDPRKEIIKNEDILADILSKFKLYIKKRYHELQNRNTNDILATLKTEALSFLDNSGIEGIARNMFDYCNQDNNVPKYNDFIKAFEKFSNLQREDFEVEIVDSRIHFHAGEKIYVIDTYEGKEKELKQIIENRYYTDIYTATNEQIWSEIYIDAGIEKAVFLPELLQQWETYWMDTYADIQKSIGKTNHLDEMKAASWRQFQVYMECYNDSGDAINLAYMINDEILYPISVVTMMNIFDADTCYSEYCEHEFFGSNEWESITIDEEDDNAPVFFIKLYES